jgi:hypothetical protein
MNKKEKKTMDPKLSGFKILEEFQNLGISEWLFMIWQRFHWPILIFNISCGKFHIDAGA